LSIICVFRMNTDADNKVVGWVRWLLSKESHFERWLNVDRSVNISMSAQIGCLFICRNVRSGNFVELLLLIVIHLLSNQTQPLTLLISSELNIKVCLMLTFVLYTLDNSL